MHTPVQGEGHGHGEGHAHGHDHPAFPDTIAAAGPAPFDDRAAGWDDEHKRARAASVAATIVDATGAGAATRLLEYGAGTGLVSEFLAGAVGAMTLAEPSAGMRAVAAGKIASGALPADARLWDLDLDTAAAPPGAEFDLVVTVLALHHVVDARKVLAGLADMLAPSGTLCIVDLESEDGSFHGADAPVAHGFDAASLTALLPAGMRLDYRPGIYALAKDDRDYPIFLAVCTRD